MYDQNVQLVLQSVPEAIIIVSKEGRITGSNDAISSLFEYEPIEIINQPVEMLISEELREKHVILVCDYMQKPYFRRFNELHNINGKTKSGKIKKLDIMLCPVKNKEDQTEMVIAIIRDKGSLEDILSRLRKVLEKSKN